MSARILVVDDEPDLESLLLQKFRHQVRDGSVSFLFARDGVDALELLERNGDVDMIVCDINMPRMDGLSLLQKLQEAERQLSTIIVSAYGDMANIRTAMNRGAFDFLIKPIDFADLEATIAKTLRHLETLREARRRQSTAERAHAALSRYFSPNLAARLASDGDAVGLAGQRREVAALFTDIAGFTTLVETMEPDTLGDLLNDYLAGMTDIVFRHEGTVAKVVGDALHVLFGAPSEQPDHAVRAVACALELDAFSEAFREQWRTKRIVLGPTRIGVNAGSAMVGNFGGVRFFDYTAYGDTINIAARLEAANKQLGTRICVSESVARAVPDFRGRPVGDLVLRGRTEPLRAYEPLPPDRGEDASAAGYGSAFARLEADDPGAIGAFAAEVGRHPGDQLASFHLKRLLNGAKGVCIQMD
ncbi:adenylate/guanylate cyclase domain-containing response regulator [Mesorhizobium sp. M4B.F.Ca.ET.190.01.1.1]|uniref:adenylate/guanylate cyclase domain-containing protein n=1 Tax=unclassified Mesorhizobium TaxID=325217 RepID=UPI0010925FB3|nr:MULTISPECIES: adenylate/guanylate cyclase domain-containing protein [unclassified Mesorhizobium]TGR00942.1 adenylate/guanylate cyclase domain-containing response regulator [Mesorhizobium sp. M4B.F.Ca.ET.200.01.1.1]TGS12659.1 adenylate/guanylate cyclase domain-containing response regulator [Mesorhizobium sp. M4B.F.Ca.ET.190.01.1.1]TGT25284.1 adenylate/guanylate cyclase domain-containing response regulator [Mesorhizobium sp. M4B.F.Ca.ET.172.01.1.1]